MDLEHKADWIKATKAIKNPNSSVDSGAFGGWSEGELLNATPVEAPMDAEDGEQCPEPCKDWPRERKVEEPYFPLESTDLSEGFRPASLPAPKAKPVEKGDYQKFPFKPVGKMFFRFGERGGEGTTEHYATAWAVAGSGKNALITAGHCIFKRFWDNGSPRREWARDIIFIPDYYKDEGDCSKRPPEGNIYIAAASWTLKGWHEDGGFAGHDLGALVVKPKDGKNLLDRIGGLGWIANPKPFEMSGSAKAIGFPGKRPFNGCRMWHVDTIAELSCNARYDGYCRIHAKSPFKPGASGGPWMVAGKPNLPNTAFAINARILNNSPTWTTSFFSTGFENLLREMKAFEESQQDSDSGSINGPGF